MRTSIVRLGVSALLLLFTTENIMAAGETTDNGISALIRSYWHLRMEGCQPATLERLRQALPGVKDRDIAMLGSALYALGVASAGNHQTYYATYKAVVAADPRTPYLEYLVGDSVSENCGTCEGSGESKVNCGGCGGRGTFVGFQGMSHPCPKCRGKGTLPVRCATCQGQRTVFSPKHAATSFDKLLRIAEGKLVNTYGDLLGFLDEPLRSQVAEKKAEEALQEKAYAVRLELAQVTSEGALAYVLNSYPRILIFVKDLESGVADGERWSGKLWLVGTHRYVTRANYEKTVKMFTASKAVAAKQFKDKEGQSGSSASNATAQEPPSAATSIAVKQEQAEQSESRLNRDQIERIKQAVREGHCPTVLSVFGEGFASEEDAVKVIRYLMKFVATDSRLRNFTEDDVINSVWKRTPAFRSMLKSLSPSLLREYGGPMELAVRLCLSDFGFDTIPMEKRFFDVETK